MSLRPTVAGVAGATAVLLALLAGPAVATAGADASTTNGSFQAHLKAYDPADQLGLPGDTHLLLIHAYLYDGEQQVTFSVEHYGCGPHEPADWPLATLCTAEGTLDVGAQRPRVDVLAEDTVRARGTIAAGDFDVTMTGAVGEPFLAHDLRRTVGTRHETRQIFERYGPGSPASATLGGVALLQPQVLGSESVVRTERSTTGVTTVPAVPVPRLQPPGTRTGDVTTIGKASVAWSRRLPSRGRRGTLDVEIGRIWWEQGSVPGAVEAEVQRQRCRKGQRLRPPIGPVPNNPCAVLGAKFGAISTNSVVDLRHCRLHVVLDLPAANHRPRARVDLTWRGRRPLGFVEVDRNRGAAYQQWFRTDRSGIRWADLRVTGTIGGTSPNRLWDADFSAWTQRSTREPADAGSRAGTTRYRRHDTGPW